MENIKKGLTLIYLITYLLLLEKPTGPHLVTKFRLLYGTERFITAFTIARHLSQPRSHFLNIHLNIILPSASGSSKWSLKNQYKHEFYIKIQSVPHSEHTPSRFFFLESDT